MQQALHTLQMNQLELSHWVEQEVESNPLLRLTPPPLPPYDYNQLPFKPTLYQHLAEQIPLHFKGKKERALALYFASSLDRKGFLTLSPEELQGKEELLKRFQQLDPLGVGARDAREALLIQLDSQRESPLYQILLHHYDDLLHQRYEALGRRVKLSSIAVKTLVQRELRALCPFPGEGFEEEERLLLLPDLLLHHEGGRWEVEIAQGFLPSFEVEPFYLDEERQAALPPSDLRKMQRYIHRGEWLSKLLKKRKALLLSIGHCLIERQKRFFTGEVHLPQPMRMQEIARALNVHESTITRALSNKGVATPRGLFALRSLFSQGLQTVQGEMQREEVKALLRTLIAREELPLSDSALSEQLAKRGVVCARRTIAKYRKEMQIGSTTQRRGERLL